MLQRWRAYTTMVENAERERVMRGGEAGLWGNALASFEDLCTAEHVPASVREIAASIAAEVAEVAEATPGAAVPAGGTEGSKRVPDAQRVTDVLMRFASNQFTFQNGAPLNDAQFFASAVFVYISRVNHSCNPSMGMVTKQDFCKAKRIGYRHNEDGGVLLAYAKRDLHEGDRLTFNYGPEELITLPVAERRQLLFDRLNFWCGCERCVAEAAADTANGADDGADDAASVDAAEVEELFSANEADEAEEAGEVAEAAADGAEDADDMHVPDFAAAREAPHPPGGGAMATHEFHSLSSNPLGGGAEAATAPAPLASTPTGHLMAAPTEMAPSRAALVAAACGLAAAVLVIAGTVVMKQRRAAQVLSRV